MSTVRGFHLCLLCLVWSVFQILTVCNFALGKNHVNSVKTYTIVPANSCCQPPELRYWDFSFGNKHFKHSLLTIRQYQNNVLSKITVRRHFCSFTKCNQNDLGRSCCYQRQQWICEDLIHTYQIGKSETQKRSNRQVWNTKRDDLKPLVMFEDFHLRF